MSIATEVLNEPGLSASARQQALNRILSDPGVPGSSTTSSFWQKEPRAFPKRNDLPKETDVVIIGSGITGAAIAYNLLEQDPLLSVTMLEARAVCSGATGRNGGHILETGDEYQELADSFGPKDAFSIMDFRLAHLDEMLAVADELKITDDCQARRVQFLSVYFDQKSWDEGLERFKKFKEAMPREAAQWTAFEEEEIPNNFHLKNARGVVAGPAGAIQPYKFVTGVLARLLEKHPNKFRIEEYTTVESIEKALPYPRLVVTDRGVIETCHVIHCTNGHIGHLVPSLRGRVFPVRGQMSAQTPGDSFPCQASEHSWVFNYERGFDYLTQLPEGQMMLGGGFAQAELGGVAALGVPTDSETSMYTDIHLSGALPAIFGRENWGTISGEPMQATWTGTMGFSVDGFPWVGPIPDTRKDTWDPEHSGEWVCAGFGGEGMVQAWLCGKALAFKLLTLQGIVEEPDWAIDRLPKQMIYSLERLSSTGATLTTFGAVGLSTEV